MQQTKVTPENRKGRNHTVEYTPIDNLLVSHTFERAPVLKGLLVYLWKHRGEEFSEYAIATEALGIRPDFDPKVDATVRVKISRLRQRLKEFYETEGATVRVRVRVPMGTHCLETFQAEASALAAERADVGFRSARGIWPRLLLVAVGCCITLLAVAAYLKVEATHAKLTPAPAKVEPLPRFWQSFLANGKPSHIVIPRPTFFVWGGGDSPSLIVRDTRINDSSGWKSSPNLTGMKRRFGFPGLIQTYTVADDALGALRLVTFLQAHDIPVTATTSTDGPTDVLGHENLIVLGTTNTLSEFARSARLTSRLDFRWVADRGGVENRRPAKGEPQKFAYLTHSGTTNTCLGTLALLPGNGPNTYLLILEADPTLGLEHF